MLICPRIEKRIGVQFVNASAADTAAKDLNAGDGHGARSSVCYERIYIIIDSFPHVTQED